MKRKTDKIVFQIKIEIIYDYKRKYYLFPEWVLAFARSAVSCSLSAAMGVLRDTVAATFLPRKIAKPCSAPHLMQPLASSFCKEDALEAKSASFRIPLELHAHNLKPNPRRHRVATSPRGNHAPTVIFATFHILLR